MTQERPKEELIDNILQLTDRAFRQLLPMVPSEWLRLDVTMSQLKVMFLLFLNGRSRMSEIASALAVSLATATGVVDRLVERGIALREDDPEDRRVVLCRLSDKGQELISSLWQLSRDQAGGLMRALTAPQLLLITEALEALLQAGEATNEALLSHGDAQHGLASADDRKEERG
jgi:DNA-binding MarR family transcriptional regulator